jgi:hypothetical protein
MQITVEALIIALRGAADALEREQSYKADDASREAMQAKRDEAAETKPAPVKKEPAKLFTEPSGEPASAPAATDEPPAPWEAEETPPQVEEVTAQDIVALYQEVATQGKKVDMLALLSSLGVERVGELDGAGRARLHAAIKKEAGI